jgi:CDP-glycerol glycerophosphotransferase (TagB/SpsB family)
MLEDLRAELSRYPNLQWDNNKDGMQSMVQANVMVSDLSGIVFDFAFLLEKPVITLKFDVNKLGSEAAELPWDPWELTVLDAIGSRVAESEVDALPVVIEQQCGTNERTEMIRRLRDESVANFGCAAKHVAHELLRIRSEVQSKPVS